MKEEWKIRIIRLTSNIDLSIRPSGQYIRITWRALKIPNALALTQTNYIRISGVGLRLQYFLKLPRWFHCAVQLGIHRSTES